MLSHAYFDGEVLGGRHEGHSVPRRRHGAEVSTLHKEGVERKERVSVESVVAVVGGAGRVHCEDKDLIKVVSAVRKTMWRGSHRPVEGR